jgi:hypothetical protein
MTTFNEYQKQTIERLATELQTVIGQTASDNHSPTLRSKLVSIDTVKGTCILEITPSDYFEFGDDIRDIGRRYEQAIQIVHNGYFY